MKKGKEKSSRAETEEEASHGLDLGFPPLPLASFFPSASKDPSSTKLSAAASPFIQNSNFPPLSPIPKAKSRSGRQQHGSKASAPAATPLLVTGPRQGEGNQRLTGTHTPASRPQQHTSTSDQFSSIPNLRPIPLLPPSPPPSCHVLQANATPSNTSSTPHPPSHEIPPGLTLPLAQPSTSAPKVFVDLSNPVQKSANSTSHLTPFPTMLCNPHLTIPQQPPTITATHPPSSSHSTNHLVTAQPGSSKPLTAAAHVSTLSPTTQSTKPSYAQVVKPSQVDKPSPSPSLLNTPPYLPHIPIAHQPPSIHNGVPAVSFSEDEMVQAEALFANSMVLKFVGSNPALRRIKEFVATWRLSSPYSVAIMDSRHTLVRMTCPSDLKKALSIEVHKIDTTLFRSFTWTPDFNPRKESSMAAVWVQFPKLPLTLFAPTYIHRIAAAFGTPLRLDVPTKDVSRIRFARACVEVDLAKPLPHLIEITTPRHKTFEQPIEYESNTSYCHRCSLRGHSFDTCRHAPKLSDEYVSNPLDNTLLDHPLLSPSLIIKTATHTYFPSPSSSIVSAIPSPIPVLPNPQTAHSTAAPLTTPIPSSPIKLPSHINSTTIPSPAASDSTGETSNNQQPQQAERIQHSSAAAVDSSQSIMGSKAAYTVIVPGTCTEGDREISSGSFSDGYLGDFFSSVARLKGTQAALTSDPVLESNLPFTTVKRKQRAKQLRPP